MKTLTYRQAIIGLAIIALASLVLYSTYWSQLYGLFRTTLSVVDSEYRWTDGRLIGNRTFSKAWAPVLKALRLDEVDLREDEEGYGEEGLDDHKTVIISAFSSNHFAEGLTMLKSIQELAASTSKAPIVYLYDIGLSQDEVSMLKMNYSRFVQLRRFDFDRYPSYVSDLTQYRWKPLVIAEVYANTTHKLLWWFDASVQISNDRDLDWYYQDYVRSGGDPRVQYPVVLPHFTSHSIFAATAPGLYEFFPIDEALAKKTDMYGATVFALFRRRMVERDVLKWWVLCALEEDCMEPPGSNLACTFDSDRYAFYANCHRYDQSALNILVAAANGFDTTRYYRDKPNGAIQVERG